MEHAFKKLLDKNFECIEYKFRYDKFILIAESIAKEVKCLFCGKFSFKIHSMYQREIQDIPMQDKQTILLLNTRKLYTQNFFREI